MAFSEAIDYHDQYVDQVTQFKPSHMNLPIDQLDYQIGMHAVAINKAGFASRKFVMVNEAGTALQFKDIVCSGGAVVVSNGEVVVN